MSSNNPGRIAFVTQSDSIGAAIEDWAHDHQIGFSKCISLDESSTKDFGECIDALAEDPYTQSILLYMESVKDAGRFISATRECAIQKPIIVLKAPGSNDKVYDAAFRRCGILRVQRMADLFYMAEVLEQQPRPRGSNLAILTNAHGPALLSGGQQHLASDATPADYRTAFETLAKDPNCHGILLILTPQPGSLVADTAQAIAEAAKTCRKPILASLMGGTQMKQGEAILAEARIPTFPYPDTAAKVFARLWQYSRNLSALYETPVFTADIEDTTTLAADLESKRGPLDETTLKKLLNAYGISSSQFQSPTSVHFRITSNPDQSFGPVLTLEASKLYEDSVATLPPLTSTQSRRVLDLVKQVTACQPPAQEALEDLLVRVSRIVSEHPVLRDLELEIQVEPDGTIWSSHSAASLQPEGLARSEWPKCVIRPYPKQYIKQLTLRNGQPATLRPIRPEDETRIVDFHNDLSERTVYLRYLQFLKFEERIMHERLARVCFNDYARELALVVEQDDKILGVGRLQRNPLRMEEAEVAFLVRDSAQGQGIGKALVENIIEAAKAEGLTKLTAELLADNKPMRNLLEKNGFRTRLALDGQTLLASRIN
jgi:GNAT superfamily N-acetyltransferase/succinyl-CoA synthetase alpha subunit